MDGLIYLLNLTGQSLAQANAKVAELSARLQQQQAELDELRGQQAERLSEDAAPTAD